MLLFNILCKETVALADISLIDLINSAMARLPCYPALWGLVGIAHCFPSLSMSENKADINHNHLLLNTRKIIIIIMPPPLH